MKRLILGFIGVLFLCSPVMGASLLISWGANTETDIGGYKVFWGTVSGTYGNPIDVGNVTSYSIPNVTTGKYCIALKAYDTSGNESGFSEETCVDVDLTAPGVPVKPTVVVTGNIIKVTFAAVTATDIASYNVYDNGTLIGSITTNLSAPSFTSAALTDGSHAITVDSVDSSGNKSAQSTATTVTIDTKAPAKPPKPTVQIVR